MLDLQRQTLQHNDENTHEALCRIAKTDLQRDDGDTQRALSRITEKDLAA